MPSTEKFTHSIERGVVRVIPQEAWKPVDLSAYLQKLHQMGFSLTTILFDLSQYEALPRPDEMLRYKGSPESDSSMAFIKEVTFIGNAQFIEYLGFLILSIPEISSGARVTRQPKVTA